jgi:hypothetical protein
MKDYFASTLAQDFQHSISFEVFGRRPPALAARLSILLIIIAAPVRGGWAEPLTSALRNPVGMADFSVSLIRIKAALLKYAILATGSD